MMKETFFINNIEVSLWKSGSINIETKIYIPKEESEIEILEQVKNLCPVEKTCDDSSICMGYCSNTEIISYVKRYIWMDEKCLEE